MSALDIAVSDKIGKDKPNFLANYESMCPYLSGLLGGAISSNRLLSSTWENNTCNTVAHNRLALVTLSVLFAGALGAGQLQLGGKR